MLHHSLPGFEFELWASRPSCGLVVAYLGGGGLFYLLLGGCLCFFCSGRGPVLLLVAAVSLELLFSACSTAAV